MNDSPANSTASEPAGSKPHGEGWLVEPKHGEGWSKQKWFTVIAIIFAVHVAIIFAFGEKKRAVPRAVKNVPDLKLVDNSSELLALDDPTLFALPHLEGFVGWVWRNQQIGQFHRQDWTEPPRWLSLPAENLGATFSHFMGTNSFPEAQFDFKPQPKLSQPVSPVEPAVAQNSTLQITDALAQRRLLGEVILPSLQYNDVIAPSKVQVLVNAAGDVVSAVLLPSDNSAEAAARYDVADRRSLEIARSLRFVPSPQMTLGKLIFNWRTVPIVATNMPVASP